MVVKSHNVEFGYELIAALPYAYSLHLQGKLTGTISGVGSEPLYFFSPDHKIDPSPRDFANTAAAAKEIPNMWIHKPKLDKSNWVPPPLKEHYLPMAIWFTKPTVVIYNRYNYEWGKPPINYFDLPTLRSLISMLEPHYKVVYFNVRGEESLEDNAHSMDLGDYRMIRDEFPSVVIIHDFTKKMGLSYNEAQLRVFAGCSKFITMNGAPCILASYFGGENIIYTKECREITKSVGSFWNWYGDFGGSHIRVVRSYNDLIQTVDSAWVRKDPLINILVRCHNRPLGMKRLLESVKGHTNVRVIASYDNEETFRYLCGMTVENIPVKKREPRPAPSGYEYRSFLGANEYLNDLVQRVQGGYIMYLDDDDELCENALRIISSLVKPDKMLLWRVVARNGWHIPSDENFGKIVAGDISGIGFCFHHSLLPHAQWEPWRRGDYRVIKSLSGVVGQLWVDMALTRMCDRIDDSTKTRIESSKQAHQKRLDAIREEAERKVMERREGAGRVPPPRKPNGFPNPRSPRNRSTSGR